MRGTIMQVKIQKIADNSQSKLEVNRDYTLMGEFFRANHVNANNHKYRLSDLVENVERVQSQISQNKLLGEIDHPTDTEGSDRTYDTVNLVYASHMITSIEQHNDVFVGKLKLLSGGYGKILRCFVDDGVKLSTSLRAYGSGGDDGYVDNLHYITQDIVIEPALASGALDAIMDRKNIFNKNENTERVYNKLGLNNSQTLAEDLIEFFSVIK